LNLTFIEDALSNEVNHWNISGSYSMSMQNN